MAPSGHCAGGWSGGLASPLQVIEQITYLIFTLAGAPFGAAIPYHELSS